MREGGERLTLTGWHGEEAGAGPAHSGNRARPPSSILMSRGGSAAGPPGGGTPSGSVGRQGERAQVRHSVNQGGRWSNNVVFGFVLFFKKKLMQKKKKKHKMRRLQGHKQEIASFCASCERRWPVMSTLCSEEPVILRNVEVQTGKRWTSLLSMPKGPVVIF